MKDGKEIEPRKSRGVPWWKRCCIAGVSLALAVLLGELGLRLAYDEWDFRLEGSSFEVALPKGSYVSDPEIGFCPRLGTEHYDRFGARIEAGQLTREPDMDKKRVLFMGDSVTYRGAIVDALRAAFGTKDYQYWNAGVESFDTRQQVAYFERCNHQIQPDHVVLTFHHNDFATTPFAYRDEGSENMVVAFSNCTAIAVNPWLRHRSYLYRLWLHARVKHALQQAVQEGEARVRDSLRRLQGLLAEKQCRLTVLVLPQCKPEGDWNELDRRTHALALQVMQDLGIHYFDLLPGLREAEREGVPLQQTAGDPWHPSVELGRVFVRDLMARGLSF